MRAVDTNVLVRLIVRDDPEQLRRAEEFVANGAWASLLVLAETIWVLDSVYRLAADQIADTVQLLLENAALSFQDPEVVEGALAAFRRAPRVGFSDCLVVEIARKAGHVPVGTFDRSLAKLDGTRRL